MDDQGAPGSLIRRIIIGLLICMFRAESYNVTGTKSCLRTPSNGECRGMKGSTSTSFALPHGTFLEF